jgi:hypothetical protein
MTLHEVFLYALLAGMMTISLDMIYEAHIRYKKAMEEEEEE